MSVRTALSVHIAPGSDGIPRPDGVASVARILAHENIRVDALAAVCSADGSTTVNFLPTNPEQALKALRHAGLKVGASRVALASIPYHPRSLLLACETLAAAGIRVDAAYILTADPYSGQRVAFACSDVNRADELLWALCY